jgi:hypothetical protein
MASINLVVKNKIKKACYLPFDFDVFQFCLKTSIIVQKIIEKQDNIRNV